MFKRNTQTTQRYVFGIQNYGAFLYLPTVGYDLMGDPIIGDMETIDCYFELDNNEYNQYYKIENIVTEISNVEPTGEYYDYMFGGTVYIEQLDTWTVGIRVYLLSEEV